MKSLFQFERSLARKCISLLFVLVIAGFGFVQAVHVHESLAGRPVPNSHCSLCVVAHSAAAITQANTTQAPVPQSVMVAASDPQLQSRLQVSSSYIRPPPQSL